MRCLIAALLLAAATPAAAQTVEIAQATAPDGSRSMAHEIIVPAPIADVWTAVATVEGWRTWAVPLAREVAGSPDRFETGYDPADPAAIEQLWIERSAPRNATFRTTRTPAGFPHAEEYMRVTSRFVLTPVSATATRVRLEGSGYPAGAAGDMLIGFFREGNRASLEQLHARFVTGPIDWAARRATPKGE